MCTSPAPSRRFPGSSRSTSISARAGSTRSSSTSRTKAARSASVLPGVPLATKIGAVRSYYKPAEVARLAHRNGIYLIGRVVVFQDPLLSEARPDLAIRRSDGSVWKTSAGLGWVNPYDRRVWDYTLGIAAAAANAGFDEIMLDYVRFPSDGNTTDAVFPGRTSVPRGELIADFAAYAQRRLAPLGIRISTALFGLSATRDMRLGQVPAWISQHVDHVNPMAYPVLYGGGELGITTPVAEPGETVFRTLVDFRAQLRGSRAQLIPWIQDWNYSPKQLRQQVEATRLQGAKGFLLWNASGLYTEVGARTRDAVAPYGASRSRRQPLASRS